MKRLKYLHPFNGKNYPVLLAVIVGMTVPFISLAADIDLGFMTAMLPAFFLTLVICFLIERRLSKAERQIVDETPMPFWHPVNAFVKSKIRNRYETSQFSIVGMAIRSVCIGALVLIVGAFSTRDSTDTTDLSVLLPIALIAAIIGFIVMFIIKYRGANWLDIDETAMYTVIPVHHCYKVKHYSRRPVPRIWYDHYLVFYQPDGRYVLKLPSEMNSCQAVIVVLYRGAVTWVPIDAYTPEELL